MEPDFDAGTYGRGFADVYDLWYPSDDDTLAAVDYLAALGEPESTVLELGIGTGRLAIPLATAGYSVAGIDSSPEMLDILNSKLDTMDISVDSHLGDVCDGTLWPSGPFDIVVAAFNFMFNLIGDEAKLQVFDHVAKRLAPSGAFVIESFVAAPADQSGSTESRLELREVNVDSVVLIASSTDHSTGTVTGQHIELRDGEPVRLRPWKVQVATTEHLLHLASQVGLTLVEHHQDWQRSPFTADSVRSIARFQLG